MLELGFNTGVEAENLTLELELCGDDLVELDNLTFEFALSGGDLLSVGFEPNDKELLATGFEPGENGIAAVFKLDWIGLLGTWEGLFILPSGGDKVSFGLVTGDPRNVSELLPRVDMLCLLSSC